MKHSSIQYIAGFTGMIFVISGLVWTYQNVSTSTRLKAAAPVSHPVKKASTNSSQLKSGSKSTTISLSDVDATAPLPVIPENTDIETFQEDSAEPMSGVSSLQADTVPFPVTENSITFSDGMMADPDTSNASPEQNGIKSEINLTNQGMASPPDPLPITSGTNTKVALLGETEADPDFYLSPVAISTPSETDNQTDGPEPFPGGSDDESPLNNSAAGIQSLDTFPAFTASPATNSGDYTGDNINDTNTDSANTENSFGGLSPEQLSSTEGLPSANTIENTALTPLAPATSPESSVSPPGVSAESSIPASNTMNSDAKQTFPLQNLQKNTADNDSTSSFFGAEENTTSAFNNQSNITAQKVPQKSGMTFFAEMGVPGTNVPSGTQSGQIQIEKIVPDELQINEVGTIVLKLKNIGNTPVRNVALRDILPPNARFVSSNPATESYKNGELLWNAFDMAAGEERSFTYNMIMNQEGEAECVATVRYNTEVSGKLRCTQAILKLEVEQPQDVMIGENVTLNIILSNIGTGTAKNIVVLENIPDGLQHPSGKILDNRIESLAPGETRTLPLTLQCISPGKIVNYLTVTADNGIKEETITEFQVNSPELQLEINGAKARYLEQSATYLLKIQNPGTAVARDVKLTAELPKEMEFVSANNLGVYEDSSHSVHWELSELPPNVPGEIELVLLPKKVGESKITFRGEGANDLTAMVSQDISVEGLPALSYNVKALSDPVEVGKDTAFEIRLSNRGSRESTNIYVQVLIPSGMKLLSSEGPTQYRVVNGGLVFDKLNQLGAREETAYKINIQCTAAGDHRIRVQVNSDDLDPLIREESIRAY